MGWFSWFRRDSVTRLIYLIKRDHKMTVVTSIDLTAGGPPVLVVVQDQNGNNLSPIYIAWDLLQNFPNANVSLSPNSVGFNFVAANSATQETITTSATYDGPGVNVPLVGPKLSINVAAAVPPAPTVTALQYYISQ